MLWRSERQQDQGPEPDCEQPEPKASRKKEKKKEGGSKQPESGKTEKKKGAGKKTSKAMEMETTADPDQKSSEHPLPSPEKSTFAGRSQPSRDMSKIKWQVLRQAFADHVRPHVHMAIWKHEALWVFASYLLVPKPSYNIRAYTVLP